MSEKWIGDTVASVKYPVFSRANAGEVMPGPVSPASVGLAIGSAYSDLGLRDAYAETGAFGLNEFESDRNTFFNVFGGHLYLSISVARVLAVRMPGLTPEDMDRQYFGELPDIPPYSAEARPDDEDPERAVAYAEWVAGIGNRKSLPELVADRDQVDQLVAQRPDLRSLSDQELVDRARSFGPLIRRLMCRHIVASNAFGVASGMLEAMLAPLGKADRLTTLVSGLGDVDSAVPTWQMWELSRLPEDSTEYQAGFANLLRQHGCRGPNEWEPRADTWGIRPDLAIVLIRSMRGAPDTESPQARNARRGDERLAVTNETRELLDVDGRAAFDDSLRAAQLYAAGRERTKTNCIKIVHEIRLALRELGRRAAETGALAQPEHVFMLLERELDAFVENPGRFAAETAEREDTYLQMADRIPPFVTMGEPPHWSTWPRRSEQDEVPVPEPGAVFTGISGCPGKIVGKARIVLDPGEPREFDAGDILIAPVTDPAWTPLFAAVSGVVVEVGAQISHAVIVSRELGLPCVASVTGATRRIPDGSLLELDGASGTVTVLDPGQDKEPAGGPVATAVPGHPLA